MRTYVGDKEAVTASEFEELARGAEEYVLDDFRALFLGDPDETDEQRAARSEAARDVLADLFEAGEHDEIARLDADYAARLLGAVPLMRRLSTQRMTWTKRTTAA